jgi:hypothetical protein
VDAADGPLNWWNARAFAGFVARQAQPLLFKIVVPASALQFVSRPNSRSIFAKH